MELDVHPTQVPTLKIGVEAVIFKEAATFFLTALLQTLKQFLVVLLVERDVLEAVSDFGHGEPQRTVL